MPKQTMPLQALANYLPNGSLQYVLHYIKYYKVHLTLTRERKTILGDYRHPVMGTNQHRISVNGNLNVYEFLITFLHELAHLITYEQYKNRVEAHGIEWKNNFSVLLKEAVTQHFFPDDIVVAMQSTLLNPAATANGEIALIKALRKYNKPSNSNLIAIEALPVNAYFKVEKFNHIFQKKDLRRTRYECVDTVTQKKYAFSPLVLVMPVENV